MSEFDRWYGLLNYIQICTRRGGATRSAIEHYEGGFYKEKLKTYFNAHLIIEQGVGDPRDRKVFLTQKGTDLLEKRITIEDVEAEQ